MSESRYLTREEASIATGVHVDTLRRDERMGKLPNCRKRDDGRTEILVADLVAAGRLDPLASDAPLVEIVMKSKTERELVESQRRVAMLEAELDHQREQLNHLREEVKFLRSLLRGGKAA
jgi:polyhydroxyalkanoate synthesis regulator phasin